MYWAYGTGQQKWLGHTHCNEMTIILPNKHCNGHHGLQRQRENKERRDFQKETGTRGFKYSWRKMEAAAQDRARSDKWQWTVFHRE